MKQPRIISAGGCLAALLGAGCSGGGVSPSSTANLPGVAALPGAITVGARGSSPAKSCLTKECIYVAAFQYGSRPDSVNVYPVSADGDVAPLWTISGPKTKIGRIENLAVDVDRNIYVATVDSILVYAPGAHGNVAPVRTVSGSNTGLAFPSDVAVDAHGITYVVNDDVYGKYSVTVYAAGANGNVAPIQTISGSKTMLNSPTGIAVDGQSNIYVLDYNYILAFAAGATGDVAPARKIWSKWMHKSAGITVNAQGAIYVGNSPSCSYSPPSCLGVSSVFRFPVGANGEVDRIKRIAGSKTRLSSPLAIALGPKRRNYVTDEDTLSIYVYATGAHGNVAPIQTIAGPNTGFDVPIGIDVR